MSRIKGRPGESMAPFDFAQAKKDLTERFPDASDKDVMSAALYPQVTEDYLTFREQYGPVDKLDTRIFLVGPKIGEEFEVGIPLIVFPSQLCKVLPYNRLLSCGFRLPLRKERRWALKR